MIAWQERPPEIANLFNPAFCGVLLDRAIRAYASEGSDPMPFAFSFLVLPIVLHEPTRQVLPASKSTSLFRWLQRQPEVRVGFADRLKSLSPYTREALMFMSSYGALSIAGGRLLASSKQPSIVRFERKSAEFKQCASKAALLGRMLALAGDPATVFVSWGIRP